MVDPFASTGLLTVAIIVLVIQIASLCVLILATFEFRSIINARRLFLSAIGYRDSLRAFFWQRFLLILYIVSILVITIGFDLLFLLRPQFF